ncbi:MAG: ROK family protein [Bacteroidales bacterium]|jgi:predicted NBD/HSP70 family sugar kinase|nr:ROK family protein [Bacteroidales bacterium]MCI2121256.1 ROK family protein [Bacteroidales bacterium]MCI2146148.1 ROK family protein [Bacteroidales bacterium]
MNYNAKPIVATLDAGGTNFVFSAIRDLDYVVEPLTLPSLSANLDRCLSQLVEGFSAVMAKLPYEPSAISFAFPGPADYPDGIIGGYLPNFPSFRDGVALGPFLEDKFGIPVFINNDGDLFAYGEAVFGALPYINSKLSEAGSAKRYHNLIGYTFGTGFGIGHVSGGELYIGDNSCVETFCLPNALNPDLICEEGVSIRAVKRVYREMCVASGNDAGMPDPEPKDIFDIAEGRRPGDREAAVESFRQLGEVAGDAIASAVTLLDGIVVLGGGLTGSSKYIMPSLLERIRGAVHTVSGEKVARVQMKVYDLDSPDEFAAFARGDSRELKVYGSDRTVTYDPQKRTGIMLSRLGASRAISFGAYAFALNKIGVGLESVSRKAV